MIIRRHWLQSIVQAFVSSRSTTRSEPFSFALLTKWVQIIENSVMFVFLNVAMINKLFCTTCIFWLPLIFILIQPNIIKIHDNPRQNPWHNNKPSIFIIMSPSKSGTGGWNVNGCWLGSCALFQACMQCLQKHLCPYVVKRDAIRFLPQPHSTIKLHLQHTHNTLLQQQKNYIRCLNMHHLQIGVW